MPADYIVYLGFCPYYWSYLPFPKIIIDETFLLAYNKQDCFFSKEYAKMSTLFL